jgi:uncharacterized membrane protein
VTSLSLILATACPDCPAVRAARALVWSEPFGANAWYALLPFVLLGVIVHQIIRRIDRAASGDDDERDRTAATRRLRAGPLVGAGLVLGTGLGGFVDGIALHQILQWHNMLSSITPPIDLVTMKYNMVWDGLFHALTWTVSVVGIGLLFRAGRRADVPWSGTLLVGSLIAGWGLFNLVEGVIDHFVLQLHHVHPGEHQRAWDLGFLLLGGLGFLLLGYLIARRADRAWAPGDGPR